MPSFTSDRVCRELWLIDADGHRHFPVRIKNRNTGRIAFNVSDSGNLKSAITEVDAIESVADLVPKKPYIVQVVSEDLTRTEDLIGLNKRKMVGYVRA